MIGRCGVRLSCPIDPKSCPIEFRQQHTVDHFYRRGWNYKKMQHRTVWAKLSIFEFLLEGDAMGYNLRARPKFSNENRRNDPDPKWRKNDFFKNWWRLSEKSFFAKKYEDWNKNGKNRPMAMRRGPYSPEGGTNLRTPGAPKLTARRQAPFKMTGRINPCFCV